MLGFSAYAKLCELLENAFRSGNFDMNSKYFEAAEYVASFSGFESAEIENKILAFENENLNENY